MTSTPSSDRSKAASKLKLVDTLTLAAVGLWALAGLCLAGPTMIKSLIIAAIFLAVLLVVTIPVRTIGLRVLGIVFMCGAAGVCLSSIVCGTIFIPFGGTKSFAADSLGTLIEEFIKAAPLLYFLWRFRHADAKTIGVSDMLLLGAFAGAGFEVYEHAFQLARENPHQLWLFPPIDFYTAIGGKVFCVAGHPIWAAIAGAGFGFGNLIGLKKKSGKIVFSLGFLWSWIDHMGNNMNALNARSFNPLLALMSAIRGDGFTAVWIFFAVLLGAVATDLFLLTRYKPTFAKEVTRLADLGSDAGLPPARLKWADQLWARRLAYLNYRVAHSTGDENRFLLAFYQALRLIYCAPSRVSTKQLSDRARAN